MLEFTTAFLKPFKWAKAVYSNYVGLEGQKTITIDSLVEPISLDISTVPVSINSPEDWNRISGSNITNLTGIFKSLDYAQLYINGLYTVLDSRLKESENRLSTLESSFTSSVGSNQTSSRSIQVRGGDSTFIETSPSYYRNFLRMQENPNEGVWTLPSTSSFSSIRSLGGFSGQAVVENTLGFYEEKGTIENITDGSSTSLWNITNYVPAPVRASQNDIPWLPYQYRHGFAVQISYYMDRLTSISEVFIDPISSESFDLVNVSWTPRINPNIITDADFPASGWTHTGNSRSLASQGLADSKSLLVTNPSGFASYLFAIPASSLTYAVSSVIGNRATLSFQMKGVGDCIGGAKLSWLDSSGRTVSYKTIKEFPTGFYRTLRLVDYIPSVCVSGRIEFGIFDLTTNVSSAWFDGPVLTIGERVASIGQTIVGPTTISLPRPVLTDRISCVFSQRNPSRKLVTKEGIEVFNPTTDLRLNDGLKKSVQKAIDTLNYKGTGDNLYAYNIGFKELDYRYKEYVPYGLLVTKPLYTTKEIRRIWLDALLDNSNGDLISFKLYPFKDDVTFSIDCRPYVSSDNIYDSSTYSEGEVLNIYSDEEYAAGWTNNADKYLIVSPKSTTDLFDGTDRTGKVLLTKPFHLRRPTLDTISSWMQKNSIWSNTFDPNALLLYGMSDGSLKTSLKDNNLSSLVSLSDFTAYKGYLPIEVTVITDKYTATPDYFGRPDQSRIRTVDNETLELTSYVTQTQTQTQDTISFSTYCNTTKTADIALLPEYSSYITDSVLPLRAGETISQTIERNKVVTVKVTLRPLESQFRRLFEFLVAQNRISNNGLTTVTHTFSATDNNTYKTKFSPLVATAGNQFLKLYWVNPASSVYLPVSQSAYEIISVENGIIRLKETAPSSGYTRLNATYTYLSKVENEDQFSTILSKINIPAANKDLINAQQLVSSKRYPLTRNMTDYVTGKIPKLRPPNFTQLSSEYYPVIEYYLNQDGYIVFSRDFFKYGDVKAQIIVKYDTLDISPRAGISITRLGAPSASPKIGTFTLKAKENSPRSIGSL